jgi:teichuronic acid biosynthesis glycosyltransferase TuaC
MRALDPDFIEPTAPLPGRPLRIVSVSIPYPGPGQLVGGLFVYRRLRALSRRADVRVINPEPWFPWLRPLPKPGTTPEPHGPPVERPRMFYLPGLLKRLDSYWLKRCLIPVLERMHREAPIDLIDGHFEYPEAVGCVMAARALNLPVFVTLRGVLTRCMHSPALRPQCLWALGNATGVISVAHALKKTAVQNGIPDSHIRVIPNAIESELFFPGPQEQSRRELNVTAVGPLIVAVGLFIKRKGFHLLIPAFARLLSRFPGARLAIIGNDKVDRPYTQGLLNLINQFRLEDTVTLVGPQSPKQVAMWLRAADVFALPTSHEGCCNAILEALACGVPVVTTPVGDNADYVEGSRGGVLVPVDDIPALARGLEQALARPWDREAIAAYAGKRGWDAVAEETLDCFHERLADPVPSRSASRVCGEADPQRGLREGSKVAL